MKAPKAMLLQPLDGYRYSDACGNPSHAYLLPAVERILSQLNLPTAKRRLFELGCGNGAVANHLHKLGYKVSGVDPSIEGIAQAVARYPGVELESGSCYEDLSSKYGVFPVVLSLEVVEHIFLPRYFAKCIFDLLEPGGIGIVSTPFHGYWKNLILAVTGQMDAHFTALWDYGHIKFWSERTLTQLMEEQGLLLRRFIRVGRLRPIAKSMIAVVQRPTAT